METKYNMFERRNNSGSNCITTRSIKDCDVQVGQRFLLGVDVIYEIHEIRVHNGVYNVYATTKSPGLADGWFTSRQYEVIVSENESVAGSYNIKNGNEIDSLLGAASAADPDVRFEYSDGYVVHTASDNNTFQFKAGYEINNFWAGNGYIRPNRLKLVKNMFSRRCLSDEEAVTLIKGFGLYEDRFTDSAVIEELKSRIGAIVYSYSTNRGSGISFETSTLLLIVLGYVDYVKLESIIASGKSPALRHKSFTDTSILFYIEERQ